MKTLDVSRLPTYAYGHRSLMWWGTQCLMAIEGTVFAISSDGSLLDRAIRVAVEATRESAA